MLLVPFCISKHQPNLITDEAPFLQPTFNYSHRPTSTGRSTFSTEPRPYHTLRELELYRITRSKEYEKWYNKPDRDRRSVQIKVQTIHVGLKNV